MIESAGVCAVLCAKTPSTQQAPVTELLGQFVRVAQSQIKPLASDGVKCLSGIPDPDLRLRRVRAD
jgi:hypothetical protein